MTVPRSHPRYLSLTTRDRLVEGWKKGLVATQGLIAHGRGEAFDYLLGETTTEEAAAAERASAALLLLASRPVISVNGNVGALSADEIGKMSKALDCRVEVNIFHRTGDPGWTMTGPSAAVREYLQRTWSLFPWRTGTGAWR